MCNLYLQKMKTMNLCTQYSDLNANEMWSCYGCFEEVDDQFRDQWHDLYSGY